MSQYCVDLLPNAFKFNHPILILLVKLILLHTLALSFLTLTTAFQVQTYSAYVKRLTEHTVKSLDFKVALFSWNVWVLLTHELISSTS